MALVAPAVPVIAQAASFLASIGVAGGLAIGGILVLAVGAGGILIWKLCSKGQPNQTQTQASSSNSQNSNQQNYSSAIPIERHFRNNNNVIEERQIYPEEIKQWEPIKMTIEQFNALVSLTEQQFKQVQQSVICHLTKQIVREPYRVKCCSKLKKFGERRLVKFAIQTTGRCPLCQNIATVADMKKDVTTQTLVYGFRGRVLKTYKSLSQTNKSIYKQIWKQLINSCFGDNYVQDHIEDWKASDQKQSLSI